MTWERRKLYDAPEAFFRLEGNAIMFLTPDAAIGVCDQAIDHDRLVLRIEGGLWHNPNFEARLDCIWDGRDPPVSRTEAALNNELAAEFVREERGVHGAFVITVAKVSGD